MPLPQHPARWILTILFLALVGLTLWIVWALDELEERKKAIKPVPENAADDKQATPKE